MKILIGLDPSTKNNPLIPDLQRAGLPEKATVVLLVACPPVVPMEYMALEGYGIASPANGYAQLIQNQKLLQKQTKTKSLKAGQELQEYFPKWKIKVETIEGLASKAILDYEASWQPHLLILGSHGWNSFVKLLIGSVADKVLTHAAGNVRIIKIKKGKKSNPPRLLIGYDGSEEAEAAIKEVAHRPWPVGTEVKILSVSDYQLRIDEMNQAIQKTKPSQKQSKTAWTWMENKIETNMKILEKAGLKASMAIVNGDPRHVILEYAESYKADVIFMGHRGISGFKRILLGSVSSAIASHAPCTVEIIRTSLPKKL